MQAEREAQAAREQAVKASQTPQKPEPQTKPGVQRPGQQQTKPGLKPGQKKGSSSEEGRYVLKPVFPPTSCS